MPPPPPAMQMQEPGIVDKMKMGFTMGGMVGLTIGFIFGTATILKNGAGPKGFFGSVSQYMLTSGATFAFFMSIGSVIRTEDVDSYKATIAAMQQRRQLQQPQQQQQSSSASPYWMLANFRASQRAQLQQQEQ